MVQIPAGQRASSDFPRHAEARTEENRTPFHPSNVADWKELGIKVTHLTSSEEFSLFNFLVILFYRITSTLIEQESVEGTTHYVFLCWYDELGQKLFEIYCQHHRGVEGKKAAAFYVLSNNRGQDLEIRRKAIKILAHENVGETVNYDSRLMVRRKLDKRGGVVLEAFHIGQSLGLVSLGETSKVDLIAEEVFGPGYYKSKKAVLKRPRREGSNPLLDVPTLKLINLQMGEVEGFQKPPKAILVSKKIQVQKYYNLSSLNTAFLSWRESLKVLEGPFKALISFKSLGIAHGDIKISNILADEKQDVLKGVIGDFERVMIFPELDLNRNPRLAQARAGFMLSLLQNMRLKFPILRSSSLTVQEADYSAYIQLLNVVWPEITRLSNKSFPLNPELFQQNYRLLKEKLSQIQVFQMGGVLASAILGEAGFLDEMEKIDHNFLGGPKPSLEAALRNKIGQGVLSEVLIHLIYGMLESDPEKRLSAEVAFANYQEILALTP